MTVTLSKVLWLFQIGTIEGENEKSSVLRHALSKFSSFSCKDRNDREKLTPQQ
jgi:hypothetical protein